MHICMYACIPPESGRGKLGCRRCEGTPKHLRGIFLGGGCQKCLLRGSEELFEGHLGTLFAAPALLQPLGGWRMT